MLKSKSNQKGMKVFSVVYFVRGVLAESKHAAQKIAYQTITDNPDGDGYDVHIMENLPKMKKAHASRPTNGK